MNNTLTTANIMTDILGRTVIGVDGCQAPYKGTIEKVTDINHRVLGRIIQVWVKWENQGEHLTGYSPRQFKRWDGGQQKIGVYVV